MGGAVLELYPQSPASFVEPRDRRFLLLEEALAASGTSAEAQSIDGAARSVADVLWSYATLGSLPPKLLTPVLTSVSVP